MNKPSDSWRTPDELYNQLNDEFHFDIDLCATAENSKCAWYGKDFLTGEYVNKDTGGVRENIQQFTNAFMNPPYSNPKPFIEKAWENSKHCKIVLLVKVDPSTKWWGTFWNYTKQYKYQRDFEPIGPKPGCEVRFLPKRVHFDPPIELVNSGEVENIAGNWYNITWIDRGDGTADKHVTKLSGPSFASCILIFDRRGL